MTIISDDELRLMQAKAIAYDQLIGTRMQQVNTALSDALNLLDNMILAAPTGTKREHLTNIHILVSGAKEELKRVRSLA